MIEVNLGVVVRKRRNLFEQSVNVAVRVVYEVAGSARLVALQNIIPERSRLSAR